MAHAVGVMNGNFRDGMYYEYLYQVEKQARIETLLKVESRLMEECYKLEGDSFIDWYDSDAVPAYGSTSERIQMIEQRIQSVKDTNPAAEAYQMEHEAKESTASEWLSHLDTNSDPRTPEQNRINSEKWDFTPIPSDMPIIDIDNIEEIPF